MGFLVSPGVEVNEIDLTNVIPSVSTSIGGIVGQFRWGRVNELVTVGSEKDLAAQFGKPTASIYEQYFQAAGFLQYANNLKVGRIVGSDAFNATSSHTDSDSDSPVSGVAIRIFNEDSYDAQKGTLLGGDSPGAFGSFFAKYPGALGNALKVHILDSSMLSSDSPSDTVEFSTEFDAVPGTNEIHVVIEDDTGAISGTAGTVLEKYSFLSIVSGTKLADGTNNYYHDVINERSEWIWCGEELTSTTKEVFTLRLGSDGTAPSSQALASNYNTLFGDAETVEVNLLIGGGHSAPEANNIISVASARKDCVAFVSPRVNQTANLTSSATQLANVKEFANNINTSSYGFIDNTALYVYDKYNDIFQYIPASGHTAGLCANTDNVAETWFSPAGFNRGVLRGVAKLAYNPPQTHRDELYKRRVNPIVSFPGQGIVLFGDKTTQSKPSAFDRINVRRLFITLEKAIATAAKFQLFELNDEFTRAQFRNAVEPFLRDVKGRRGVTDFLVVCDETNNTGEVIDGNRFVADIFIKPARSINFISLNFIATRTGVEFSEIVGTN